VPRLWRWLLYFFGIFVETCSGRQVLKTCNAISTAMLLVPPCVLCLKIYRGSGLGLPFPKVSHSKANTTPKIKICFNYTGEFQSEVGINKCHRTAARNVFLLIIIIISIHEFRPGWPVSVSAVISSSSLLSGRPGRRLSFG
jgi:hypothetical protein